MSEKIRVRSEEEARERMGVVPFKGKDSIMSYGGRTKMQNKRIPPIGFFRADADSRIGVVGQEEEDGGVELEEQRRRGEDTRTIIAAVATAVAPCACGCSGLKQDEYLSRSRDALLCLFAVMAVIVVQCELGVGERADMSADMLWYGMV